jgi:hypothetical protein
MNSQRYFLLLAFTFVLLIGSVLAISCGGGGDDDDSSGDDDDAQTDDTGDDDTGAPDACDAEQQCLDESTDCVEAAQNYQEVSGCVTDTLNDCMVPAGTCTATYSTCFADCAGDEACLADCLTQYNQCYTDCGFDGECHANCMELMGNCLSGCNLEFECMKECYITGYSECFSTCF